MFIAESTVRLSGAIVHPGKRIAAYRGARIVGYRDAWSVAVTRPEIAGRWPEPIWRARIIVVKPFYHPSDDPSGPPLHLKFRHATLVAQEPSWRSFGPRGKEIEAIVREALALPAAQIRHAADLDFDVPPVPVVGWGDGHAPLPWILQDPFHRRLSEKAQADDPSSGHHERWGDDDFWWEFDDEGWRRVHCAALAAMIATVDGDDSEGAGAAAVARWRRLVASVTGSESVCH